MPKYFIGKLILASLFILPIHGLAEVSTRTTNNGNLVMQDIPDIPSTIVADLNRYQNVRSASFQDWTANGKGVYVSTRFGDVNQIHRVDQPGGMRRQLSFFDEPITGIQRKPKSDLLSFTMDTGGSEFTQIFLFDPDTAEATLLTDGESRNGAVLWNRQGTALAYQSTKRNGQSNDLWLMQANDPDSAKVILESPDGSWWGPVDFDESGQRLLVTNYIGATVSNVYLLDLQNGDLRQLTGGFNASVNLPFAFDHEGKGFWFMTDRFGEFNQLAWQSLAEDSKPELTTGDIPWNVETLVVNDNHQRGAFTVNENGRSKVYLMDMQTRAYQLVDAIPTGLVFNISFSPDSGKLGVTLNTPKTPSDTYTLSLGNGALESGALTRWTTSEVGGLDTDQFIEPELVHYPTFDQVNNQARQIPAWVYKPKHNGPHPVVISIHGGPEGQARPNFSSTTQLWLEKLDAAVIVPNVRGSSGYGKSYVSLDNGFKREDSVKDIGALLDWIATQDDLDENNVAVFGGSYGGYMVLASAVHYSSRLKAAVDIVGISSFVTFLENTQDYRRDLRRIEYGDERDPKMRAHLQAISPLTNIDKVSVPMLVAQGHNDPRVPYTEAEQVVSALRNQGRTVWYMDALNEGHGYRKKENRDVYQQAVMLFLQQNLGH